MMKITKETKGNTIRKYGYRILRGDLFSYILHLRPAEWPIMMAHTMLGYFLAVGFQGAIQKESILTALKTLLIWVVFLNGGTLALNSVFDRDKGDIGYLKSPPPPPVYLLQFSLFLMCSGLILSFSLPPGFTVIYAICFLLSVLYSVPPFRFKAVAGIDWLINMIGFGTLTPLAAYIAVAPAVLKIDLLVMSGFCPLFAALYPLTQLYQFEEDKRRKDRTFALVLGMKRSLIVSFFSVILAFCCFYGALFGKYGDTIISARSLTGFGAITTGLVVWLCVIIPWYRNCRIMTAVQHQKGMYYALTSWAVTDLGIFITFV